MDAERAAILMAHPRSSHWPAVRAAHLLREPTCAVCGGTAFAEVHHVKPYHLWPELELEPSNFITLCEAPSHNHHLLFGHLLAWSAYHVGVREDAALWRAKILSRPYVRAV